MCEVITLVKSNIDIRLGSLGKCNKCGHGRNVHSVYREKCLSGTKCWCNWVGGLINA